MCSAWPVRSDGAIGSDPNTEVARCAVGVEHEIDIPEWVDDPQGAQINEDVSGLMARPAGPQFGEVGCAHAPANCFASPSRCT